MYRGKGEDRGMVKELRIEEGKLKVITVRKQVKNPCEAHKIKASQILHKKLALTSCYYSVAFVLVHRVP